MHIQNSIQNHIQSHEQFVELLLREAKKLHRAAVSTSLATSLPVLRRLLSTQAIHGISLPELSRRRNIVQRKHVLRALAVEAGYSNWEKYRAALTEMKPEALQQFDVLRRMLGYPNLWFSSMAEAEGHVAAHGGQAIRVGQQALVFSDASPTVNENRASET